MNNLRQLALATLNYESANMKFPACTGIGRFGDDGSANQLGGFVAILPFLEQNDLYEQITQSTTIDGVEYPAFPPLHESNYKPWQARIPALLCPSLSDESQKFGMAHYGFCIGDRARNVASPSSLRGVFGGSLQSSFWEITDGSSNTICLGEIGSNVEGEFESPFAIDQPASLLEDPSQCQTLVNGDRASWTFRKGVALSTIGRGGHWADGRAGVALFNTILPPKSPSAAIKGSAGVDGIYSTTGPHPGTLNVALCDGSVHAISFDVDAGDSSKPTPTEDEMAAGAASPYGVWGALGSGNDGIVPDVSEF
jgi:prepilin-type processing-associated H-X9-DG protein